MFRFDFRQPDDDEYHDSSHNNISGSGDPAMSTLCLPPWQSATQLTTKEDVSEEEEPAVERSSRHEGSSGITWSHSQSVGTSTSDNKVQYIWHFDMINDVRRNSAYRCAIAKVIQAIRRRKDNEIGRRSVCNEVAVTVQVLDVGTGSGLLALLAAKHGATHVTAIEIESAVYRAAVHNVALNKMQSSITLLCGHSMDPSMHVPVPVDMVVTELLDTGLLGEAFIPVLRDAKRRGWMREDCKVIPARGRVFGQIVESTYLRKLSMLDASSSCFGFQIPEDEDVRSSGAGGSGANLPFECAFRELLSHGQARVLSAPFVAWDFDFENLPPASGRSRVISVPATATGTAHVVLFWWEVSLDGESEFMLSSGQESSAAGSSVHQDHWTQAYTIMRREHLCEAGQSFEVQAFHSDETIWFEIVSSAENAKSEHEVFENSTKNEILPVAKKRKTSRRSAAIADLFDAERLYVMNSCERNQSVWRQLSSLLKNCYVPRVRERLFTAVLVGDGPLLPLLVADCFRKLHDNLIISGNVSLPDNRYRILNLEGTEESQALTMKYLLANNCFPPLVSTSTCDPAWVVKASSVNLVCSEPFFQPDAFCKTWGKSALVRYWLACAALTPFLVPDAHLLPASAVLRVAAVECEALWLARQPCRGSVEGLDLSALNALHSFQKTDSIQLWRYEHRFLSKPLTVLTMNFWNNPMESLRKEEFILDVSDSGTCHGLVMWIDYSSKSMTKGEIENQQEGSNVDIDEVWCSTAPSMTGEATPYLQGIRFCPTLQRVLRDERISCTAVLDIPGNDISAFITE